MNNDMGAAVAKFLAIALALAIVSVGGWSFYKERNRPDYRTSLSPEAQLEYEVERQLALITIANEEKADPWHVSESISPKDDSEEVIVYTDVITPISIRGGPYEMPEITIRCMENVTSVLLMFDSFIGSRDRRVEHRVDERPLQRTIWSAATDNKAIGLWRGAQAIPFIKSLLGGERLLVWLTPHNSLPILIKFNIKSLEKHIDKVANKCNWSAD